MALSDPGPERRRERHSAIAALDRAEDDEFSMRNLRMFVGKKANIVDVYGNSNHPRANLFNENAVGFNYAFVASSDANENIAVAGDSAGGGLSVAASISLRDGGEPMPSSVACISPWTDLELSGDSIKTHASIDPMLTLEVLQHMASNYIKKNNLNINILPLLHCSTYLNRPSKRYKGENLELFIV